MPGKSTHAYCELTDIKSFVILGPGFIHFVSLSLSMLAWKPAHSTEVCTAVAYAAITVSYGRRMLMTICCYGCKLWS